jgi:hypothetical protein
MPLLELLENLTFPKSVSSSRKTVASCGRRLLKLGKQCDLGCFRAVVANMVEPSPGNWYRMVVVCQSYHGVSGKPIFDSVGEVRQGQ